MNNMTDYDDDQTNNDEFSLSAAARAIGEALGVPVTVAMTGGGCGTIEVGPTDDNALPILTMGPGSYWSDKGSSLEFHAGLCDYRFGDPAYDSAATMPEYLSDPVAWLVDRARELMATADDLPSIATSWDEI